MKLVTKSGHAVHPIGIGTWDISSKRDPEAPQVQPYGYVFANPGHEDTEIEALRYSLSQGQNHLDCAELYGAFYTDEVVGRALTHAKREDLFIADKLWRTSVAAGKVRPTVKLMLKKLRSDYLDLLYIHAPWPAYPWREAIPQIDQLIDEGIVRHFGVSNFTIAQMEEAQKLGRHPLTANQMNFNVLYRDEVTPDFEAYCHQHDIAIVAYQPIKRGAVTQNVTIQSIAQAHNATPSQVALAWLLQRNTLPIPKTTNKSHIDENLGALELKLTGSDLARLNALA